MNRSVINSSQAPSPVGPYSQGVQVGDFLFCSGQIPLDPKSGELLQGSLAEQTIRVMENLRAVLAAGGCDFSHVVKTTIFLTNMSDFAQVNEVYGSYFLKSPPARSTIQVAALPKGAKVEIEALAYRHVGS